MGGFLIALMNSFVSLSVKQLKQAVGIKAKIDRLQKQLSRILGTSANLQVGNVSRMRRRMSATARKKIAAVQRARWAKVKGNKQPVKASKKKRKISAAGLARIRAAQKARWAKIKARRK